MTRIALVFVVIGLVTPCVLAEDLSPPPWDQSLGFPETSQTWQFPALVGQLPQGTVLAGPMYPSDLGNPFGESFIEWPNGPVIVPDPITGEPREMYVEITVQPVPYMPPFGQPGDEIPGTPTVHVGVLNETGAPDPSVPVPVSIWIPNNPDPNLVKKIFWQMTSDKSPTPQANPPTTNPPGTSVPTGIPQYQHDGSQWYTYNGMNEIRPNPDGEWLTFGLVDSTNIEEIVIKTVCMPEPATLALLGLGGLAMLVRRKR